MATWSECQEDKVNSRATNPEKEALTSRDVLRKVLPAAAGSFIEFYEFGIFAYMSADITGNFFANGHGGSLGTWAGFAVTLAVRPLGGVVFGALGDRYGRKPAMQITIAIMLATTLVQGMLPTFLCCGEGWGWFGLAVMMLLRILQGLSAGGELSTAATYITEVSPRDRLGLNLSWIAIAGIGSWCVASLVVFGFQAALTKQQMLLWGWRLPYLLSIIPGAAVILGRRYMEETPEFENHQRHSQFKTEQTNKGNVELGNGGKEGPSATTVSDVGVISQLLAEHKLALLVGSLGAATFGVLCFVPSLYGPQFIQEKHELPAKAVTLAMMMNHAIPALLAPAIGMFVDRWGVGRVYTLGVLLGGVVVPAPVLYWWAHVSDGQAIMSIFVGQALLGFCLALQTPLYLWMVELFPVHVRATGVSIVYNIGVGVFGGLGPLICDAGNRVINPQEVALSAPAIYTVAFGMSSLVACLGSRLLAKRGTIKLAHIREKPY